MVIEGDKTNTIPHIVILCVVYLQSTLFLLKTNINQYFLNC